MAATVRRRMEMMGLRQGAFLLEGGPDLAGLGIEYLPSVDLDEDQWEWGDGQNAFSFRQFLGALEQHRRLEELRFVSYRFCLADPTELDGGGEDDDEREEWEPPPEVVRLQGDGVARMFGTVLPNHPSVGTLQLRTCRVHAGHLADTWHRCWPPCQRLRFAAAGPSSRSTFSSCHLLPEAWEAVAEGLRGGARVGRIRVEDSGLAYETCRILYSAAASNPSVEELFVRERDADVVLAADCLGPVLAPASSSSVRSLTVAADRGWTGRAATEWMRLLRACTQLETLTAAVPMSPGQFETLLEVLRPHNFTLRNVGLGRRADPARQQAVDRPPRASQRGNPRSAPARPRQRPGPRRRPAASGGGRALRGLPDPRSAVPAPQRRRLCWCCGEGGGGGGRARTRQ